MKYLSKKNITIITTFSILLLIMVSFILCNPCNAQYKTRITVDTVNLEITPYQPVDTIEDDVSTETVDEGEEDNTTDVVEENE